MDAITQDGDDMDTALKCYWIHTGFHSHQWNAEKQVRPALQLWISSWLTPKLSDHISVSCVRKHTTVVIKCCYISREWTNNTTVALSY